MFYVVIPAEAGIQCLKQLLPGYNAMDSGIHYYFFVGAALAANGSAPEAAYSRLKPLLQKR